MARFHSSPWGTEPLVKNYKIGVSVVAGQVVVLDATGAGEITDPSANDYTECVGVTTEAGTYSTTAGTGDDSAEVVVEVECDPFGFYLFKLSGGAAADTAWQSGTDSNIMTQDTASQTVITEADVGTSEYVGGIALGLTGDNKGFSRGISAHSDNTSTTVSVPFDYSIAVGDTLLRIPGRNTQGHELTATPAASNWTQINARMAAGEDLPGSGHGVIAEIYVDANNQNLQSLHGTGKEKKARQLSLNSETNPSIFVDLVFVDHVFKSLA